MLDDLEEDADDLDVPGRARASHHGCGILATGCPSDPTKLLKSDWPKTLEEMEERRTPGR